MRTINLLFLRHFMPLILVTCGFSALVINRISIEYGETNLVSSEGEHYEKIISCNLLYSSRLRTHGLRRQGSRW